MRLKDSFPIEWLIMYTQFDQHVVMGRTLKVRARAGLRLWKSGSGRAWAWALPWMPGLGPWRALKFYYVQQSKSLDFPALLQKSGSGSSKKYGPRAGPGPGLVPDPSLVTTERVLHNITPSFVSYNITGWPHQFASNFKTQNLRSWGTFSAGLQPRREQLILLYMALWGIQGSKNGLKFPH